MAATVKEIASRLGPEKLLQLTTKVAKKYGQAFDILSIRTIGEKTLVDIRLEDQRDLTVTL